ncbi:MAG: hypothetical protein FWD22_07175, partial [Treponema sp.]|nr:hypothetical protein [Treponema sp.]
MKIFSIPNEKIPRILYIVLLSIAGALIVLLLIGTIVGLARPRNAAPVLTFGSPGQAGISAHTDDMRVFSGLGRLRIPLLNQSTLLLTIA